MAEYYLKKGQLRNYVLVITGTYTALRIKDLLKLKWANVYDEEKRVFRTHIAITEKKTRKTKIIAPNQLVLSALRQSLSD